MHYVYLTTNTITGHKYIGKHSTKNTNSRYLGSGTRLKLAIEKYGRENFTKEILSVHESAEAAYVAEDEAIHSNNAIVDEMFYNIAKGGRGGSYERTLAPRSEDKIRRGWHHTIEAKIGMSKNHSPNSAWPKGMPKSEQTKMNMSKARTGVKLTEEHCKKISISSSGERSSQYGSFWITNGLENRKVKNIDTIPQNWYKGRTAKSEWYLERGKNVRG